MRKALNIILIVFFNPFTWIVIHIGITISFGLMLYSMRDELYDEGILNSSEFVYATQSADTSLSKFIGDLYFKDYIQSKINEYYDSNGRIISFDIINVEREESNHFRNEYYTHVVYISGYFVELNDEEILWDNSIPIDGIVYIRLDEDFIDIYDYEWSQPLYNVEYSDFQKDSYIMMSVISDYRLLYNKRYSIDEYNQKILNRYVEMADGEVTSLSKTMYLSVVSISTLGIGDITPKSNRTRNLIAIEATIGPIVMGMFLLAIGKQYGKCSKTSI